MFEKLTEVQNSYMSRTLELHAARRDPVTGLPNRSLLLDLVRQKLERLPKQPELALALLFVDLDHFKDINDQFGHDAGDSALRLAAQALQRSVRDLDVVGRYGGDEFLVCVAAPGDTIEVLTSQVAARMLAQVGEIGYGLGCSIGWALYRPGMTLEELVESADQAMLQAKRSGKNRAVRAPDDAQAAALDAEPAALPT